MQLYKLLTVKGNQLFFSKRNALLDVLEGQDDRAVKVEGPLCKVRCGGMVKW